MNYYIAKTLTSDFATALQRTLDALKREGFGVISDIDLKKTLWDKLHLEFRDYRILGACNPALAHEALRLEDKLGTLLPCNVIVQDMEDGNIEIAAVDPLALLQMTGNQHLRQLAEQVQAKMIKVIDEL
ncbi:MAG TPA: DUF302 domain-containing protein [Alphaproteobacteria bacterium]|nr:DUF302 domain-containing protein [Alphaproteobacteria bacterium]